MKKYAALFGALFFIVALSPARLLAASDETCAKIPPEQKQHLIDAIQKQIDHWNSLSTEEMREELRATVEERNAEYLASDVRSLEIEAEIREAMNQLSLFDDVAKELLIAQLTELMQAVASSSCSAMGMALPLILWPCSTLVVVSNWQSIESDDGAATKVAKVAANTGLTALLAVTIPVDLVWDVVLATGVGTYATCNAIASSVKRKQ